MVKQRQLDSIVERLAELETKLFTLSLKNESLEIKHRDLEDSFAASQRIYLDSSDSLTGKSSVPAREIVTKLAEESGLYYDNKPHRIKSRHETEL